MTPPLTGAQIRETFLAFFERELGHKRLPSASLVPVNNPTVMLTPAGMLPFVPIFLGVEPAPNPPRAVSSQKCARVSGKASDLEAVGRTPRHHTFFEMLGNFSFGDYFKAEIIPWSWRLLTQVYGLDPNRLIVTVFEGDEQTPADTEAEAIWRDVVGIPADRILRFPAKDNFWGPPGPTGPCGPCSEIHYDLTGNPDDPFDTRYMEIWNLVFMEFFKDGEGRLTPLDKKNVDTGMGLERITCILQNKPNTFETDLLQPILQAVATQANLRYGDSEDTDIALKIVTDHLRFLAFALADGVVPSNEGRGYIARMILRRAVRYGKRFLGFSEPFLFSLVEEVTTLYGHAYPELVERQARTQAILQREEERFFETLEKGNHLLELIAQPAKTFISRFQSLELNDLPSDVDIATMQHRAKIQTILHDIQKVFDTSSEKKVAIFNNKNLKKLADFNKEWAYYDHVLNSYGPAFAKSLDVINIEDSIELKISKISFCRDIFSEFKKVPGDIGFKLYDTYGFPVELTKDILAEHGLELDEEGFHAAMAEQKAKARAARKNTGIVDDTVLTEILQEVGPTPFVGYDTLETDVTVTALIVDGERVGEVHGTNTPFLAVLDRTPFYPEGGGQVGDRGTLIDETGEQGRTVLIKDAQKVGELIVHHAVFDQGEPVRVGDTLKALVEPDARQGSAIHHSATHLLHAALRQVLGPEAAQAGSYVAADGARFDFSFPRAVTADELARVEALANRWIREGGEREIFDMTPEEAKAAGAIAMFGEKYDERVRVVRFGPHSIELCGGTHAGSLAEIGLMRILGEQAVASGVRRIEFVVGEGAYRAFKRDSEAVRRLALGFKVQAHEVLERVEKLQEDLKARDKAIAELQNKLALVHVDAIVEKLKSRQVEGAKPLTLSYGLKEVSADGMRALAQGVADKVAEPFALLLGSEVGGKVALLAWVSEPLTKEGLKAGEIVKAAAQICGGNGGGKPTLAQAGGPDVGKLSEALASI